jgi:hypothetical protein
MTVSLLSLSRLTDSALLAQVKTLAGHERQATGQFITSLAELDARRLYLGEGCSSLFTYCSQVLRLSEHAAYGRIEAARIARRFPIVLELLTDGSLNLTTVGLLAPHLTPKNHASLFERARHKSKREVEIIVASLRPRPDVPSSVRKLPAATSIGGRIAQSDDLLSSPPSSTDDQRRPESSDTARKADAVQEPAQPAGSASVGTSRKERSVIAPLAPARYKIQFTASRENLRKTAAGSGRPSAHDPERRRRRDFRSRVDVAPERPLQEEARMDDETAARAQVEE